MQQSKRTRKTTLRSEWRSVEKSCAKEERRGLDRADIVRDLGLAESELTARADYW
jgi:hypothetical protein